jgi:hypothetical protein
MMRRLQMTCWTSDQGGVRIGAMQMIPFGLPLIVAVSAVAFYVAFTEASIYSKAIVLVVLLSSFIVPHVIASSIADAIGLIMQVLVGVYVLIYLKVAK